MKATTTERASFQGAELDSPGFGGLTRHLAEVTLRLFETRVSHLGLHAAHENLAQD